MSICQKARQSKPPSWFILFFFLNKAIITFWCAKCSCRVLIQLFCRCRMICVIIWLVWLRTMRRRLYPERFDPLSLSLFLIPAALGSPQNSPSKMLPKSVFSALINWCDPVTPNVLFLHPLVLFSLLLRQSFLDVVSVTILYLWARFIDVEMKQYPCISFTVA